MKIDLSDEQRGVARGMALACVCVISIWIVAWVMPSQDMNIEGRCWLLAVALLGPAISLTAGIMFIARHRFFHEDAINGQNPQGDVSLARAQAYLANTTEQALLAAMVYPALAFGLSAQWIMALPLCALAFLVGRVGFARGVGRQARYRAFGFALTFYATLSGLLAAILLIVG